MAQRRLIAEILIALEIRRRSQQPSKQFVRGKWLCRTAAVPRLSSGEMQVVLAHCLRYVRWWVAIL